MTRIYTRPTSARPWKLAMVVGQGVNTGALVRDLKKTGLRVFIFHEQPQMIQFPKETA